MEEFLKRLEQAADLREVVGVRPNHGRQLGRRADHLDRVTKEDAGLFARGGRAIDFGTRFAVAQ